MTTKPLASITTANSTTVDDFVVITRGSSIFRLPSSFFTLTTDSRLTDARTPIGVAGGDLTGEYPNPTLGDTLAGNKTFSGTINLTNSTVSSSSTTGALVVVGGVGVGGDMHSSRLITTAPGFANPTFTTRSAGTRIVLFSGLTGISGEHAIGLANFIMWFSLPNAQTTRRFAFFGGTTEVASIGGTGIITGTQYNLSALNTAPASATATGTLGEIRVTATHIFVCVATNTWVRAALTTW